MPFCLLFFFCFVLYLWKKSKNLLSWGMKNKFILHFALDLNILKRCDDFILSFSSCTNWQLSILRHLLFLIYINNLPKGLQCNQKLLLPTLFYFLPYKIFPQTLSIYTMILQKSLNGHYNWKWILILMLSNYLAEKTSSKPYLSLNFSYDPVGEVQLEKPFGLVFRSRIKLSWTYSMNLN